MRIGRTKQRAGLCVALGCVALAAASCTVQRVPIGTPAATKAGTPNQGPYDFQKERPSPPAPSTDSAAAPTLDTPQAADLGSPGVAVQDLPAPAVPAPAVTSSIDAPPPAATTTAGGFRVQVMAATDAVSADRTRADIESRLGVKAYVVYQSPYYKVRAGNCPTQEDCRALQDRLRGAGFNTVWLVPDAIER